MRVLLAAARKTVLASIGALYLWRVPVRLATGLLLLAVFGDGPLVAGLYNVTGLAAMATGLLFALLSALILTQLRIVQVHGPDRFGTDLPAGVVSWPRVIARWAVD